MADDQKRRVEKTDGEFRLVWEHVNKVHVHVEVFHPDYGEDEPVLEKNYRRVRSVAVSAAMHHEEAVADAQDALDRR